MKLVADGHHEGAGRRRGIGRQGDGPADGDAVGTEGPQRDEVRGRHATDGVRRPGRGGGDEPRERRRGMHGASFALLVVGRNGPTPT